MGHDGDVVIGTKLDTDGFDDGIKELEKKGKFSKVGDKLGDVFKKSISSGKGFLQIVAKIVLSIGSILTSIVMVSAILVGAIAGILIISKAIEKVFEKNEQIKTDLEYMVFAITSALDPAINSVAGVLEKIVNLLLRALQYVGYIIYAITGKNIFQNATTEAFAKHMEEANKSSKGIAKNAKEVNRQLAKFDEMEILQDKSGNDSSDSAISGIPSIDLSKITDEDVPNFITTIKKNIDKLIPSILGLYSAVQLFRLGLSPLKSLGIGTMIAGLTYSIINLIKYLDDPSFKNFGKTIVGIGIAILGLSLALSNWIVALVGANILIIGLITQHWEKIKSIFTLGIEDLEGKADRIRDKFGNTIGDIYDDTITMLKNIVIGLDGIFSNAKNMFDNFINFLTSVFQGKWEQAWEHLGKVFRDWGNGLKSYYQMLLNTLSGMVGSFTTLVSNMIGSIFKNVVNGVLWQIEYELNQPINAINTLAGKVKSITGIDLGGLTTIRLPRLAKGTILNNPGQGVPVAGGRAIAGESGREAYLPLSDSQLLEELGSTIGRYITVSLTNVTELDGRTIARKVTEINNNTNFLLNR